MSTATITASSGPGAAKSTSARASRILSIDALRAFVMFTMIFVNDLAGAPRALVPNWMVHFSDRHHHGESGMTFVDLVFPGFLFIVGMSIPFALGSRLKKGESPWRLLFHVIVRAVSLLVIGIMMVNERPNTAQMGWSGSLWCLLMYLSAMAAFCSISGPGKGGPSPLMRTISTVLRVAGFASLVWLAIVFRGGRDNHAILTLSPFEIYHSWYGILGLIGWSYLVGSIVYIVFRNNRTALLACVVLLLCLYPADKTGMFDNLWLSDILGVGEMLGAHPSITVAGVLLATILVSTDIGAVWGRTRFTLLYASGFAAAALLVSGLYGISKNDATPSWCLWSCAITALLWLGFYYISDVRPVPLVARPLAVAGQNVLLAYLISEMLESLLDIIHLGDWYDSLAQPNLACSIARSAGCGVVILCVTVALNKIGFRLKL
jgi:heparan-alpha-glucosaminide N-acetyltransferase